MSNSVKTDDVIFNFFKQICDEKDDKKCVELGNSWINAMETNLNKMEANFYGNLIFKTLNLEAKTHQNCEKMPKHRKHLVSKAK